MSAERRHTAALIVLACGLAGAAQAETPMDTTPDLALLEYLGSWEESDEEWLLFSDESAQAAEQDEDGDDAGTETEDASRENGHES